VIAAWDYVYKTIASTWVKTTKDGKDFPMGMGYHTRGNPELCLLAARAKGVRPADNSAARPLWKNATRSRRYQGSILELPTDMNFRAVGRRPQKESPKWQL
jgi:N6-adenosine-specific RNA methylase IME4